VVRYGAKRKPRGQLKLKSGAAASARKRSRHPGARINSDLPGSSFARTACRAGDRIVGIRDAGRGRIHDLSDPVAALKDFEEEPERWLGRALDIDETMPAAFPGASWSITSTSRQPRPGRTVIADTTAISTISACPPARPIFTELTIDLEVYDLKHLSAIIRSMRAKAGSSPRSSGSMGEAGYRHFANLTSNPSFLNVDDARVTSRQ